MAKEIDYESKNYEVSPSRLDTSLNTFKMIDNYIYVYHTGILIAIPTYPETIQDQMNVKYNQTEIMGRPAPIFSYANSGPRSMQIELKLHRDLMSNIDYISSKLNIQKGENSMSYLDDDYIDVLVKELQACAVPKYSSSEKMIDPPMVAVRFGNDIFCKGIVNGPVAVTHSGPILRTNKYAKVDVSFAVSEVDPYDAETIMELGSYRGINTTLERNVWRKSDGSGGHASFVR